MSKELLRHLKACRDEIRTFGTERSFFIKGVDTLYEIAENYVESHRVFTDYPFTELGDEPGIEAPIRECELIAYDGNKYCMIKIHDRILEVKAGYLYNKSGRCGEVECLTPKQLNAKRANF